MNINSFCEISDHPDLTPNSNEFGEGGGYLEISLRNELEGYDQRKKGRQSRGSYSEDDFDADGSNVSAIMEYLHLSGDNSSGITYYDSKEVKGVRVDIYIYDGGYYILRNINGRVEVEPVRWGD